MTLPITDTTVIRNLKIEKGGGDSIADLSCIFLPPNLQDDKALPDDISFPCFSEFKKIVKCGGGFNAKGCSCGKGTHGRSFAYFKNLEKDSTAIISIMGVVSGATENFERVDSSEAGRTMSGFDGISLAECVAKDVKNYSTMKEGLSLSFDFSFVDKVSSFSFILAFLRVLLYRLLPSSNYKSVTSEEKKFFPQSISLIIPCIKEGEQFQSIIEKAKILSIYSRFCGDLIEAPASFCNCQTLASAIKALVKSRKEFSASLKCEILDENECESLGMGAFTGVAKGSIYGARLIHLTYNDSDGHSPKRRIALVGKGITFDTGGYNIKHNWESQLIMKCDMGGAAMVLSSAFAIAEKGLKNIEVHFIAMCCENSISSDAYKPGDILRASNGMTIEVLNTDAEGRLALCDGLVYAEKVLEGSSEESSFIIDVATLTGNQVMALGTEICAAFSTCEKLLSCIKTW